MAYQNLLESEERIGEGIATLSVCPDPPWIENPYRPVNLWDMLQIHARRFVSLLSHLDRLQIHCQKGTAFDDMAVWDSVMAAALQDCRLMELNSAVKQLDKIGKLLTGEGVAGRGMSWIELENLIGELRNRVEEDLEESLFFHVSPERVRLCFNRMRKSGMTDLIVKTPEELFGAEAITNFPSTTFDIGEAYRSLLFDRGTACVFHLMRIMEIALCVFADRFGVPSDRANWQNIIEGIEKAIRNMVTDPTRAPDWKDQQEFFAQAATQFMFFKEAWRNHVTHRRQKYTEEEAMTILVSTRTFVQKLAPRLHE